MMKGIAHGACDYLLKPVRIEELKNIWQHVVRRRKFSHKDYSNFDNGEEFERHQIVSSEGGQDLNISGSANQNGKLSRKRKDQNEEDEDDCEENVHENEDLTTQKKPRVVWSIDLHRKFVAAVNQLGIDSKNFFLTKKKAFLSRIYLNFTQHYGYHCIMLLWIFLMQRLCLRGYLSS